MIEFFNSFIYLFIYTSYLQFILFLKGYNIFDVSGCTLSLTTCCFGVFRTVQWTNDCREFYHEDINLNARAMIFRSSWGHLSTCLVWIVTRYYVANVGNLFLYLGTKSFTTPPQIITQWVNIDMHCERLSPLSKTTFCIDLVRHKIIYFL